MLGAAAVLGALLPGLIHATEIPDLPGRAFQMEVTGEVELNRGVDLQLTKSLDPSKRLHHMEDIEGFRYTRSGERQVVTIDPVGGRVRIDRVVSKTKVDTQFAYNSKDGSLLVSAACKGGRGCPDNDRISMDVNQLCIKEKTFFPKEQKPSASVVLPPTSALAFSWIGGFFPAYFKNLKFIEEDLAPDYLSFPLFSYPFGTPFGVLPIHRSVRYSKSYVVEECGAPNITLNGSTVGNWDCEDSCNAYSLGQSWSVWLDGPRRGLPINTTSVHCLNLRNVPYFCFSSSATFKPLRMQLSPGNVSALLPEGIGDFDFMPLCEGDGANDGVQKKQMPRAIRGNKYSVE